MIASGQQKSPPWMVAGTLILVIALLHWGRPVLVPLALALLLTFLLNPIVNRVQRWGLWRAPAVVTVVLLVFSLLGGIGWAIGVQIGGLMDDLPEYKDNVRNKIMDFRTVGQGTPLARLQETIQELAGELNQESEAEQARAEAQGGAVPRMDEEKPVPVIVQGDRMIGVLIPPAVGPFLQLVAMGGLVVVLVIFMLLRSKDLRNRVIRLIGYSQLTTTTKALDEAAERISQYLLMQTLINTTYGIALGIGLYLIGLPYVTLWAFLAFVARYIPYVGPWLGAVFPVALSLVVFDGWMQPFLVIGLVVSLELVSNMVMEPLLYGHSAGISDVAIVLALAFWTWIWGPIGLALATPLTVCLVVLSKHIPGLSFIEALLGDQASVERRLVYYQRLLALDRHEASQITHEFLKEHPASELFDELLVPALNYSKRDLAQGKLELEDQQFIVRQTRIIVERLDLAALKEEMILSDDVSLVEPVLFGWPVNDEADEAALFMLKRLLEFTAGRELILPPIPIAPDPVAWLEARNPRVVCIASLPLNPLATTRSLCRRLRDRFPDMIILAGRWGLNENGSGHREQLLAAGANEVGFSLLETTRQILQFSPLPHAGTEGAAPLRAVG